MQKRAKNDLNMPKNICVRTQNLIYVNKTTKMSDFL